MGVEKKLRDIRGDLSDEGLAIEGLKFEEEPKRHSPPGSNDRFTSIG